MVLVLLRGDYYQCFPFCATPAFSRTLPADEYLIHLDDAIESVPPGTYHRSPQFVQPVPGSVIAA
jgi:hypothetical protein